MYRGGGERNPPWTGIPRKINCGTQVLRSQKEAGPTCMQAVTRKTTAIQDWVSLSSDNQNNATMCLKSIAIHELSPLWYAIFWTHDCTHTQTYIYEYAHMHVHTHTHTHTHIHTHTHTHHAHIPLWRKLKSCRSAHGTSAWFGPCQSQTLKPWCEWGCVHQCQHPSWTCAVSEHSRRDGHALTWLWNGIPH